MHLSIRLIAVILPLAMLAASPAAQPQDPQAFYAEHYGKEEANAAREPQARIALAAKLLKAAGDLSGDLQHRPLRILLLRKAYTLGSADIAGYETAAKAMQLLPKVDIELQEEADNKLLKLGELQLANATGAARARQAETLAQDILAAGDRHLQARRFDAAKSLYQYALRIAGSANADAWRKAAQTRLRVTTARVDAAKNIDRMKETLSAKKEAATARRLVLVNLLELDDPAEAARFAPDTGDKQLIRIVELAVKPVESLEEAQCLELARWYTSQKPASDSARLVCLTGARKCYERYRRVHTAQDADLLIANKAITDLAKQMNDASLPELPAAREMAVTVFRPLFNGADFTGWMTPGGGNAGAPWTVENGSLVLKNGSKNANIFTRERFGDFVLDMEYFTAGNSGILFRTDVPGDPVQTSIEVQIELPGAPSVQSAGAIFSALAPAVNAAKPNAWNRVTVSAVGPSIVVHLNGQKIVDMNLDQWTAPGKNPDGSSNRWSVAMKDLKREGHIGLQDYGQPVMFRSICVCPLTPGK